MKSITALRASLARAFAPANDPLVAANDDDPNPGSPAPALRRGARLAGAAA